MIIVKTYLTKNTTKKGGKGRGEGLIQNSPTYIALLQLAKNMPLSFTARMND